MRRNPSVQGKSSPRPFRDPGRAWRGAVALSLLLCGGCASAPAGRDTVVQLSTLGALTSGLYRGLLPVREMARYGDFGLGTFDALDGEMVQLDGKVFRIAFDGTVHEVEGDVTTPFFTTAFFKEDLSFEVPAGTTLRALGELIDRRLPSRNFFYAVRIQGLFRQMRTRSVPRQSVPYPTFSQVTAGQAVFELGQVQGTGVGFRSPAYAAGLNAAGYHLHFLSQDRSAGGHVLDLEVERAVVSLDLLSRLEVLLPQGDRDWNAADIPRDPS